MFARAEKPSGAGTIVFSLDAVVAYDLSKAAGNPTQVYLAHLPTTILITFPLADFDALFLRYKTGKLSTSDFVHDSNGEPIGKLLKFYT